MNNSVQKIFRAAMALLFLAVLAVLPLLTVYLDLKVFDNGIGEISVTEITQESMLLLSALIFLYGAWRKPQARGFLLLGGSFFACLFIRETDQFLDNIRHGFWVYPGSITAAICIALARFRFPGTTLHNLAGFTDSKPYPFILVGLVALLILSRTFGSGSLLFLRTGFRL